MSSVHAAVTRVALRANRVSSFLAVSGAAPAPARRPDKRENACTVATGRCLAASAAAIP